MGRHPAPCGEKRLLEPIHEGRMVTGVHGSPVRYEEEVNFPHSAVCAMFIITAGFSICHPAEWLESCCRGAFSRIRICSRTMIVPCPTRIAYVYVLTDESACTVAAKMSGTPPTGSLNLGCRASKYRSVRAFRSPGTPQANVAVEQVLLFGWSAICECVKPTRL